MRLNVDACHDKITVEMFPKTLQLKKIVVIKSGSDFTLCPCLNVNVRDYIITMTVYGLDPGQFSIKRHPSPPLPN